MKKFGKIFMIAAAAAMVLVSCDKNGSEKPVNQPTIEVAADPATIEVGKTGNINLTLSEDAAKDITVTLAASSDAITLGETSTKIAKGSKTATVTFEAKKGGDVNVSVSSSDAKAGNPAAIKVIAGDPGKTWAELCEISYPDFGAYGSLGWAKMGDTTIEGSEGGNEYFIGENVPLNSALSVQFLPSGAGGQTGATDQYVVLVFADWNNSGKLTKIATSGEFAAGSDASTKSFTLDIPADAGEIGTIRILSTFIDPDYGISIDDDGCGTIESGSIFDIQFVNAK